MLKRVSFTISVLTTLSGAYLLYSLTVTPLLTPSMRAEARPTQGPADDLPFEPPAGNMEDAERYLPDAPWAARAKFQIHMASGVLFANSWRPIDDSRENFEFKPFAMIRFDTAPASDGSGGEVRITDKPPFTIMADAGLIRFASKFDPVNQKPGRVIRGKLEGAVRIAGPDGLSVVGRDLFFSEESAKSSKLWSDWPVDFTFQRHRGHADHGLQIDLLPGTEPPRPNQMLSAGGVRNVQLRGPVQMELQTEDAPLSVSCDEKFDFNFESKVASIQINARVSRATGPNEFDLMHFKFLDLLLDDGQSSRGAKSPGVGGDAPGVVPTVRNNTGAAGVTESAVAKSPPSDERGMALGSGRWTVKEIHGSSDQRGKVVSDRSGLTALMSNLRYDVPARRIHLQDANGVIVRQIHQGWELRSPELDLLQTPDGQVESAEGQGKGRLVRYALESPDESSEPEFDAHWRSGFRWTRVPNSELDQLELRDQAVIRQFARETGLAADLIQLLFDRPQGRLPGGDHSGPAMPGVRQNDVAGITTPRLTVNGANQTVGDGETSRDDTSSPVRPRQLLAFDNVTVISPQMRGRTKQLRVDFEESFDSATPASRPLAKATAPKSVTPASKQAGAKPANRPAATSAKPSSEPLELTADAIRARVALLSKSAGAESNPSDVEAEVREIWTEGKVEIQQARGNDPNAMYLAGRQLHLRNVGGDGQVVHLTGQPAVIRDRGFDLEGNNVFLDRARNLTWIEGAGALRLPVNNDLDGHKLASPALLTIGWKERMDFDGLTATFLNDVKAVLNDSQLQCQEMEVTLSQRISFREESDNPQAEVRRVHCRQGVELEHHEYVHKDLTQLQQGRFAELMIDQKTNRMEGIGPGELKLWRPGRGNRAALAPRASAQANRPLETDSSNWEFTQVAFFGQTNGNIRERQTTFNDRVRIVYGPVAHPLDTIDPDNLPRDGGEMQCDSLTILQHRDVTSQKSWVELTADRNVKLEGRSFHARADSISFDESKELYTLRSAGDRQVTIWRQTIPGGDYQEASGKSIWFIPSQNKLKLNQATGIRGSN